MQHFQGLMKRQEEENRNMVGHLAAQYEQLTVELLAQTGTERKPETFRTNLTADSIPAWTMDETQRMRFNRFNKLGVP